ncbi:MAG: biopolymer transporter ExbD [Methylacidiphilales bacterium]|nr:biopolymer transporter ExbD [Candidatus Methylacidiphilales bacterium]
MAKKGHAEKETDVDLTAFLNILVTVIPVLLSTAVFSRMAVTQLNLPTVAGAGAAAAAAKGPTLTVEVIVRGSGIEVTDGKKVVRAFANVKGSTPDASEDDPGYRYKDLNDYLLTLKGSFPDKNDATILIEPQVKYDFVVSVIDAIRLHKDKPSDLITKNVFPDLAIGDAP